MKYRSANEYPPSGQVYAGGQRGRSDENLENTLSERSLNDVPLIKRQTCLVDTNLF